RARRACRRASAAASPPTRLGSARDIREWAELLLRKRHVREVRDCPEPLGKQGIRWLDGEALCVTDAFWHELRGQLPSWLGAPFRARRTLVSLPDGRTGLLVPGGPPPVLPSWVGTPRGRT